MLTKLSDKQKKLKSVIRDKWINQLTMPIDEKKITEGCKFIYHLAKLKEPKVIILKSPLAIQYAANLLDRREIRREIRQEVWQEVWQEVEQKVEQEIGQEVRQEVEQKVEQEIGQEVRQEVEQEVWQKVRREVRQEVWQEIGQEVWQKIWQEVEQEVWQKVRQEVEQNKLKFYNLGYYLSSWYYDWFAYYDFFTQIKAINNKKFNKFMSIIQSGIYETIQLDGYCLVSTLPKYIKKDERKRLHSVETSAIKWTDGYEQFYINGVNFTEELWRQITTKTMPAKDILKLPNQEQKAIAIQLYGWDNLLKELKADILDEQLLMINGDSLLHQVLEIKQDNWIGRFLRYTDPSDSKQGILRVDHNINETKTVEGAREWGFKRIKDILKVDKLEFSLET